MHIRHSVLLAAILFTAVCSATVHAQQDGWAAVKTEDGVVFVDNRSDLHYTLAVKGKDIKPLGSGEHIFLSVDGLVFQVQVAEVGQFAPDARKQKLDDKAILAAHRDWEWKFLEDLLKNKLTVQSTNLKLSSGAEALAWQFDMPLGLKADGEKQLYLTTTSGDYVIVLNAVANIPNPEPAARKFLLDTIATLKISPTPIDVQKLAESIKNGP